MTTPEERDAVAALIEAWSRVPEYQVGVPYRRMASEAASILLATHARRLEEAQRAEVVLRTTLNTVMDDARETQRRLEELSEEHANLRRRMRAMFHRFGITSNPMWSPADFEHAASEIERLAPSSPEKP
jgi:hypothetical protein